MAITTSTFLPLQAGRFRVCYHKTKHGECVSFSCGNLRKKIPIVRIHSACLFGEAFSSQHCDCGEQLAKTLALIKKNKAGVLVYSYAEGRGIGLEKKIKSMELGRRLGIDSVEALDRMGYKPDLRQYQAETEALNDLKVNKTIRVVSANPNKIKTLEKAGYNIQQIVKLNILIHQYNRKEFLTKKNKLGYYYD